MKNKKLLANLLFAVVILAIAAVLLVVRRVHASGSGLRAELIYGDNNTTMNLPLDVDETYDVTPVTIPSTFRSRTVQPGSWIHPARITSVKALAGFPTKIRPPPAFRPVQC